MEEQHHTQQPSLEKPTVFQKLKRFIMECRRVIMVTKKPTKFEYRTVVKVSGLGMFIIGLVGFVLHIIKQLLIGG